MGHHLLEAAFDAADRDLAALETAVNQRTAPPLPELVERAIGLVRRLMIVYLRDEGVKAVPDESADILDVWKVLVKGEPFWNTLRDNCRELVYYRNCLAADRGDALPAAPDKMTVRTARHVFLFIKTQCVKQGRLAT